MTTALRVLTQNLYLGADLSLLFGASAQALPTLAGRAWDAVRATDFPRRAALLANLIAAEPPDLIGLQEAALWQVGSAGRVAYDFAELLRAALRQRGVEYAPVVLTPGFSGAARTAAGEEVRLTDREVVLARTASTALGFENGQGGTFAARLSVAAGGRRVSVPRAWAAVDVRAHGALFRFVTTHLEAYAAAVREAQLRELLAGPLATQLPTLLVGDLNGGPGPLLSAGFRDAGPAGGPLIDFVLYRGPCTPLAVSLIEPRRRGAWASDHPGVLAVLALPLAEDTG